MPDVGARRSNSIHSILGGDAPLGQLAFFVLGLAEILRYLGAKILIDPDDLKLRFTDF